MKQSETKIIKRVDLQEATKPGQRFESEFLDNFESKHTRIAYKKDLEQFFNFLAQNFHNETHPLSVKRIHVIQYKKYLSTYGGRKNRPAAPKTINRKLAAISAFYDFLIQNDFVKNNPVQHVKRPKDSVQTETCDLSDEQVKELFKTLDRDKRVPIFHKTILTVFLASGIRKSEIINLKVKDYGEEKGIKFLKILGKGSKYHRVPLHPFAIVVIEDYLKTRHLIEEDFLFSSKVNSQKPLCPSSIDYIVKKYTKMADIAEHITAHSLRATVIGTLLDAEVDIYKVAQLVNHESVKTTQSYDKRRKKMTDSAAFKIKYF